MQNLEALDRSLNWLLHSVTQKSVKSADDSVFTDVPISTTMMQSRLSFRLANPADAELLGRLNFQLIRDEGHRDPMSEPELANRMREWLGSEEYQAAIFFLEADLIAYVLWRKEGVDQVYLRQFFVARGWRRRGIGKAAFHIFAEELLSAGTRIKVDVLCGNLTGLSFWRSLGFRDYVLSLERESHQSSRLST